MIKKKLKRGAAPTIATVPVGESIARAAVAGPGRAGGGRAGLEQVHI